MLYVCQNKVTAGYFSLQYFDYHHDLVLAFPSTMYSKYQTKYYTLSCNLTTAKQIPTQ